MKPLSARLDKWIWILIYGGMALFSIGFALQQQARSWGLVVMVAGVLAAVVGVVLIWVRSRMADAPPPEPATPPASEAHHEHPRP